jgi:hypothetical protein
MTREEIVECICEAPEDELGDVLLEIAVEYWLHVAGITPDELVFLVEEIAKEEQ